MELKCEKCKNTIHHDRLYTFEDNGKKYFVECCPICRNEQYFIIVDDTITRVK